MSTYESKGLTARYYLRTITRQISGLWLVLFLIMGLSMADMAQYAGLAEGAATVTVAVAATGAISGKILDQSGRPLTNIQILALNQSTTTTIGGGYMSPPPYGLSVYPPWTPEGLSTSMGQSFSPYGAPYPGGAGAVTDTSLLCRALSKADGTFLLGNLVEGRYSLWAYDPQGRGFEPVIFGYNSSGAESKLLNYYPYSPQNILVKVKSGQTAGPFSMTMPLGGKMSGRITDIDTGVPIKGAVVQAYTQDQPGAILPLLTSTDVNGNFTISGLAGGKTLMNVSQAEGYITNYGQYYPTFEENTYTVVAGQETSGCNLALKRSGTVSGKVSSKVDGKPIAGAQVSCFRTGSSVYGYYQSNPVISGADGTYRTSSLEPDTYIPMVLHAPGFQGAYYPNTQDQVQAREIQVESGKDVSWIDFQLAPSKPTGKGIIRGQVIDKESGLGVAGIQVNLSQSYMVYGYNSYPPYGKAMPLRNRDEAAVSGSAASGAVSSSNTYATTAYATTVSATPISAPANVSSSVGMAVATPQVPADIAVAPAFDMYMSISYMAYEQIPMEPTYYLPSLSDYSYTADYPVWTDQEGRFEFTGLEYGSYSLYTYDSSGWYLYAYCPQSSSLELSEKQPTLGDIKIPLRRGGQLEGKVLAGITPLAGIQVMAIRTGDDYSKYAYPVLYYGGYGAGSADTTDTAGEFTIRGLEEGEYTLMAQDTTGSLNYMATYCLDTSAQGEKPLTFTVTAGSAAANLVISMKTGASISGKVLDKTGKPLAGIVVSAGIDWNDYSSEPERYASAYYYSYTSNRYAVTANDGTYTVNGLSEGTYTLNAMDSNQEYQGDCCSGVKAAPPAKVSAPDLVLTKGIVISGRVTSQDGQPLANVYVSTSPDYSSDSAVKSDQGQNGSSSCYSYQTTYGGATTAKDGTGTYRITGLAAGSYRLEAYDQEGVYLSGQYSGVITGAEGEVKTNLDLHLTQGGIIKGTIRDAATGKPISGLTVMAQQEPGNDPYATALYAAGDKGLDYYPYGYTASGGYATTTALGEYSSAESMIATVDPATSMVMPTPPSAVVPPDTLATTILPSAILPTDIGYYPGYYPSYGRGQTYSSSSSDSQGNYTLKGLPVGKCRVYIADTNGKNYISQYYAGASSMDEATAIEVGTAQTIEHIDFNLSAGIIIKGTLKDTVTRQPITGSSYSYTVTLSDQQGRGVKQAYTSTSGEYQFTGIRPGTYAAMVGDSQYYYYGLYSQVTTNQQAPTTTFTISLPGPVSGIDIFLEPKATISGQVVDEFDKKPLANITITAMTSYQGPMGMTSESLSAYSGGSAAGSYSSFYDPYLSSSSYNPSYDPYSSMISSPYYRYYQSATTDADGKYTIRGLGEGNYMLQASDYSYIYGSEYYKDVSLKEPEKANLVHVGRSENKGGIDLALKVGETYTGANINTSTNTGTSANYYPTTGYSYNGGASYGGASYGSTYSSLSSTGSTYGSSLYGGAYNSNAYGAVGGLPVNDGDREAQWYNTGSSAQAGLAGQPPTGSTQYLTAVPTNVPAPAILSSNSIEKITAGRSFTYQVKVNDLAANTSLKYSLTHAPKGMNITDSGQVQWQPSNTDAGQAIVQLMVDNGSGQVAMQAFSLKVEADTKPPEEAKNLTAAKGDQKVTLSWTPSADRDGDLADQILYVKEGHGSYDAGTSLGKTKAKHTLENRKNDQLYTFKITARDALGNESTGVTTTATPAKAQPTQTAQTVNQQLLWPPLPSNSLWLSSSNSLFGMNMNVAPTTDFGIGGWLNSTLTATNSSSLWSNSAPLWSNSNAVWANSNSLWPNSNLPWTNSNTAWSNSNSAWSNSNSTWTNSNTVWSNSNSAWSNSNSAGFNSNTAWSNSNSTWTNSNSAGSNNTSTLGLWNTNTAPVSSWGNYSTTSSGGLCGCLTGNNSLWNSGSLSGNIFTNQNGLMWRL